MLACPPFCLLQFVESGVNVFDRLYSVFDRLYSVAAPLRSGVLKLVVAVCNDRSARSTSPGLSLCGLENRVAEGTIIITESSIRVAIFIVSLRFVPHVKNA
jgi:hypothetical protein